MHADIHPYMEHLRSISSIQCQSVFARPPLPKPSECSDGRWSSTRTGKHAGSLGPVAAARIPESNGVVSFLVRFAG